MKKSVGFTIVEVLITVTIAGILAAIAAPSFAWLIRDSRFTTEANNMVAAFNMARSEAAKRGAVARIDSITVDSDLWGNGWTLWVDSDGDAARAGSGTATAADDLETMRVGDPLKSPLTLSANDVVSIRYQGTGIADGRDDAGAPVLAPYTFDLCNGEAGVTGRRITIINTGHVSVANLTCP